MVPAALQLKVPHGTVPPSTQVPVPLHVSWFDCTPPTHDCAAHTVPNGWSAHALMPLQTPVIWQLDAASCAQSLSGSWPFATGPHTPSRPWPFLVAEQASQVPEHAVSQQKPSTQLPLVHWLVAVHALPSPRSSVQTPLVPTVAVPQNWVAPQFASAVHASHTPALQNPLWQSPAARQSLVFGQGAHEPPQSTSVSSPFLAVSVQAAFTQVLVPNCGSHTSPITVQSASTLHATQVPAFGPNGSAQTDPPFCVQAPEMGV